MDNSTIGIKIADGTYFPVIEGESTRKKKLVLTTVNDDQASVQIDLYKGAGQKLDEALYIGSLVIEDIMPEMKGDPEIELIIGVDENGTLNAVASDAGSGEIQSLSVSLKSFDEGEFETPNFELDETVFDEVPTFDDDELSFDDDELSFDDDEPALSEDVTIADMSELDDFTDELTDGDDLSFDEKIPIEDELPMEEESVFDDEPPFDDFGGDNMFEDESLLSEDSLEESASSVYDSDSESYPDEYKKKHSSLAIIILVILILAILGLGAFLVVRGLNGETVPPLEAENKPAVNEPVETAEVAEVAETVETVEVVPDAIEVPEPASPSLFDGIPPEGQGGGVWYRLKWGDTLWDLSNSFYRTPWLFELIAVENGIKNPDIIYAGTDILIPEN